MSSSKCGRALVVALVSAGLAIVVISSVRADPYTVGPGETLSYIAGVYDVTVGQIAGVNSLPDPDLIFPGEILQIPGIVSTHESAPAPASSSVYEVADGDTLSAIGWRYGVSLQDLMAANGITDPDFLSIGQVLTIPQAAPTAAFAPLPDAPPDDPQIEAILDQMAAEQGIDQALVKALAWVESTWNQGAVSPAGAHGVMQVMPDTALWLEADHFGYDLNEEDSAYDNVKMGTVFLRILLDETGWDTNVAIASYYQGLAPTQAGVLFDGSQGYVNRVLAVKAHFWP